MAANILHPPSCTILFSRYVSCKIMKAKIRIGQPYCCHDIAILIWSSLACCKHCMGNSQLLKPGCAKSLPHQTLPNMGSNQGYTLLTQPQGCIMYSLGIGGGGGVRVWQHSFVLLEISNLSQGPPIVWSSVRYLGPHEIECPLFHQEWYHIENKSRSSMNTKGWCV